MTEFTLKNKSRVPLALREKVKKIVRSQATYLQLFSERERMKFYCIKTKQNSRLTNLIKELEKKPYVEKIYYSSTSYCRYRSSLFIYFKKDCQINNGKIL
jgi:hypothetical protein